MGAFQSNSPAIASAYGSTSSLCGLNLNPFSGSHGPSTRYPYNWPGLLPRFGWIARGAGVTAYTALRGGKLVDYAETKDSIFANARNVLDWDNAIKPEVRDPAREALYKADLNELAGAVDFG